ncbi:glycosyltransferase [Xenorhabdus hominickii]|uniref:Uncharacterized protein n=1 Tax=Xenorhabdus hominickii TaxID=351679 RepID=A0A2G0QGF1_XENHO|nr:glycosyltransferase [Xenorhabdus hominickii]AOM42306.1 hypothetical protein A9255_18135 [Xenorhabdus hominickii]PHM58313.1 hypothetical protein Xhom_01332 [Xenorhabdus hominickii]
MNIPKKIHYFWTGNNISENDLKNIITMKYENPGFEVNIWGRSGDKSLILNTLRTLNFKFKQQDFDIGDIFGTENLFIYRDVEEAFSTLFQDAGIIYKSLIEYYKKNNNYNNIIKFKNFKENAKRYGEYPELMHYLHHVYHLHLNGDFRNYAASSDIVRLIILYTEGGIYLDTDVELTDTHIKYRKSEVFDKFTYNQEGEALRKNPDRKTARFEEVYFPPNLGFGDVTGRGWGKASIQDKKWNTIKKEQISEDHKINSFSSIILKNLFGNAIISARQYSTTIFDILLKMATEMKRNHFLLQINKTSKADKINAIEHKIKLYQDNLRIDKALKYYKTGKITLDKRCNLLDPIWRTGIDSSQPAKENSQLHIRQRRINKTLEMTGPGVYARYFGLSDIVPLPESLKINSKRSLLFKKVDASANWSAVDRYKKKK